MNVDKKSCLLDILDTAGQEMYSAYQDKYFQSGDGFVIVYSVTEKETFTKIATYLDRIRKAKDRDNIPTFLVGNKIDAPNRAVSTAEGEKMAKDLNVLFMETSAKTNVNIAELFRDLIREIRKDVKATTGGEKKRGCHVL
eukprot:TRINITY_DN458_c0_g4_i1.p1 TRINITY_DN458_c0_g4~~TRINITY_DN458_c0_g4_i1.p1  ORF type:complete len:140 (-),score=34.09 TRINITY_DN458_c0_g4_i1:55-474(-)